VRCVGEQFVSYPQLSLHFRQHANNVTIPDFTSILIDAKSSILLKLT